jgi:hypothetical protein
MSEEQPKKISAAQVEVIDAQGQVIQEAKESNTRSQGRAQMKVFKGGPAMLLLLPILIPLAFVGFFLLMIFALIFGRKAFRVIKFK